MEVVDGMFPDSSDDKRIWKVDLSGSFSVKYLIKAMPNYAKVPKAWFEIMLKFKKPKKIQ